MRITVKGCLIGVGLTLFTRLAVPQTVPPAVTKLSDLPDQQHSAINAAITRWNRQFKWTAHEDSENQGSDASVEKVHLGAATEEDLVVTDQTSCSPTGNCSILIFRPVRSGYRVVLDGNGQMFRIKQRRNNGFHNVEIVMHGSATMYEVKVYKFNGSRYLRSCRYEVNFTAIDSEGNIEDLDKPRISPCR